MYPLFHPDRPYFVNLGYLFQFLDLNFSSFSYLFQNEIYLFKPYQDHLEDVQRHYLKYLDKFGPEEKLPGFLMTNQQMIKFIQVQTECFKIQDGQKTEISGKPGDIFNCPV